VPVAEPFYDYLGGVVERLRRCGVRAELDTGDERFNKKIRTATQTKAPFILIAGGEDAEAGSVSFRFRDGRQDNGVPVEEAIERVLAAVRDRVQV
jgi:threonyl-tRNA synthetase